MRATEQSRDYNSFRGGRGGRGGSRGFGHRGFLSAVKGSAPKTNGNGDA
jgi:hypothetical protein